MPVRVVWRERNTVSLEEFRLETPGARQVLVQTRLSLVSTGTERAFLGAQPNTPGRFPQYPGYSLVGIVTAVGPEVTQFNPGDRVACKAPHQSHAIVPITDCFKLPSAVTDENAVFFELLSIVSSGLRKVRLEFGDSVAIFGAGLVACIALKLLRLSGAMPVVVFVRTDRRRAMALRCGADTVLPVGEDYGATFGRLTGEPGARIAIDATDDPAAILDACRAARPMGKVLLLGSVRGTTSEVNFYRDVHKKGLTLVGAHSSLAPRWESSTGYWTRSEERTLALRMLELGRLSLSDVISDQTPWQQAADAYRRISEPNPPVATAFRWSH